MRPYVGHNLMRPYAGYNLMRPYAEHILMRPYAGNKLMRPYAGHNLMWPYAGNNLIRPYAGHNLLRPYAGHNLMRPYAGYNLMRPYAGHNLMRPYAGQNISEKQIIFNYRLCRARRYVECAFRVVSNKWRILHTALNVSKDFSKDIVKPCVLLHNLVRRKDGYKSEELYVTQNWNSVNRAACSEPRRIASDVRDRFADCFVCRGGALPWQMDRL